MKSCCTQWCHLCDFQTLCKGRIRYKIVAAQCIRKCFDKSKNQEKNRSWDPGPSVTSYWFLTSRLSISCFSQLTSGRTLLFPICWADLALNPQLASSPLHHLIERWAWSSYQLKGWSSTFMTFSPGLSFFGCGGGFSWGVWKQTVSFQKQPQTAALA